MNNMDLDNNAPRPLVEASTNDQCFLLNFIMGTYLGPDVKTDLPRRSASQRIAEGLPEYSITDLGTTFLKLSDVESLYYYLLRNAHPSAILKSQSLYLYFKGNLPPPNLGLLEDKRQFTSFFPLNLHAQCKYRGSFKIFKGIVIIDEPDTSFMNPEDLERFKCLSGANDLKIDRNDTQYYRHGCRTDRDESQRVPSYMRPRLETSTKERRKSLKRRHLEEPLQVLMPSQFIAPPYVSAVPPVRTLDFAGPSVVVLATPTKIERWDSKPSFVLTGTAKDGRAGPPVGLVDIGISKDAYIFRVALPGVTKDQCQFSCEVESDGKVQLRGMTLTGERYVLKEAQVFEMKTQQLCPPGPFMVSFFLPGPVDPRLFKANFYSDGILEAIVMKYKEPIPHGR
ncbi:HSP20-like chaperones superfamily protein [Tasmannia lanceolata]|uniref:HSP20-like chaperones superfamily protein n=1 Tax=Tasmannia lanceolata TaxID=3420 RepID=UPI00406341F2